LKCKKVAWNHRRMERRSLARGIRSCEWCKSEFKVRASNQRFCTERCATYSYQKRIGRKNPGFKGTILKCAICSNSFVGYHSRGKFCSKKCRRRESYLKHGKSTQGIEKKKLWVKLNADKVKVYKAKWIKLHPEEVRLNKRIQQGRRDQRVKSIGGSFTKGQWLALLEGCRRTCKECSRSEPEVKLTIDHIVPIAKWDEWALENNPPYLVNDIENIQPLCGSCNSRKQARL